MLLIKKTKLVISTNVAKANDGILAIISFDKRIKKMLHLLQVQNI